jgi:hypothetical protein
MSAPSVADLDGLKAAVTKQAALVRQLKADGASGDAVQAAVSELKRMREVVDALAAQLPSEDDANKWKVNKKALEDTLTRRMFVVPAFEIHGGVAGLFDYGPPGCALKENVLQLWRQHFVLEDGMLQIECTTLTPYPVLKASGHVDRFEDLMVKDPKTGECFRADKLLEDFIENLCAVSCLARGRGDREAGLTPPPRAEGALCTCVRARRPSAHSPNTRHRIDHTQLPSRTPTPNPHSPPTRSYLPPHPPHTPHHPFTD